MCKLTSRKASVRWRSMQPIEKRKTFCMLMPRNTTAVEEDASSRIGAKGNLVTISGLSEEDTDKVARGVKGGKRIVHASTGECWVDANRKARDGTYQR